VREEKDGQDEGLGKSLHIPLLFYLTIKGRGKRTGLKVHIPPHKLSHTDSSTVSYQCKKRKRGWTENT
jgi:hypothetical protein